MLNRRIVRLGRKLIPGWVLDQINPFDRFMREAVEEFARRLPRASRVLDAGAGEAQYRGALEAAGHRYWAIDLGAGEPDWSYSGIDAFARVEDLPFPAGCFDGVMSLAVIEHTPYPQRAVREMSRALKPGGALIIVVPTVWEEHQVPNDFYRFTRYGIRRLLEAAGFQVEAVRPIGGYFWFMGRKSIDLLGFFESFPRCLLWPLLVVPFGFVLPVLFKSLDGLDRDKYHTIGQLCYARKAGEPGEEDLGRLP